MTSTIPAVMDPPSCTAMNSCGPARLAASPTGGGWGWECAAARGRRMATTAPGDRPDDLTAPTRPSSIANRRGRGPRAGRAAGLDGGEGDRRAPGPYRLPPRAPVHAASGTDQHRIGHRPICVAAEGDRAGLASRSDRHHRHRPGPVRRTTTVAQSARMLSAFVLPRPVLAGLLSDS